MAEVKHIDPYINQDYTLKYYTNNEGIYKEFELENLQKTLAANKIFPKDQIELYDRYNRFGYVPIYSHEQVCREYLFFTKPDLNIFGDGSGVGYGFNECTLNSSLSTIPFFTEAAVRHKKSLSQLQNSVIDNEYGSNPFMYLLSNTVTSKLDLPGISADSRESTSNIMGVNIQYRSHSYKSDNGYDFSLSFTDTAYLDLYTLLKAYDEYMRMLKIGENNLRPIRKYIEDRVISEQFSIYKFLVGEDGETILYYAKLTGCYFTDVPRSDMSDPGPDGFKYSVSFHAQFVEDSNPAILSEFNRLYQVTDKYKDEGYAKVYDYDNNVINNTWGIIPKIVVANDSRELRLKRRGVNKDYRLKWIDSYGRSHGGGGKRR